MEVVRITEEKSTYLYIMNVTIHASNDTILHRTWGKTMHYALFRILLYKHKRNSFTQF